MQSGENMKDKIPLILLTLVFFILLSTAASAAVDWKVTPSNPTVGDSLKIKGTASSGESVRVDVSFDKTVPVSGGKYQYSLSNVKIPVTNNNIFTVKASGVKTLTVGVKDKIWITKTAGASGGIATISQLNVSPGTYQVLIYGSPLGSSVNLKITASQTLTADSKGKFEFTYDTSSMPAGKYTITIGNTQQTVELKAKK